MTNSSDLVLIIGMTRVNAIYGNVYGRFFFYGKLSLEQMEHLAKQEKVIGDGKF